ncbi:MAG: hypothetical protein M3144_08215, partial [Actinomycetota bacterium]|nr:hypothetical protein [Actinomycetota bacterium]
MSPICNRRPSVLVGLTACTLVLGAACGDDADEASDDRQRPFITAPATTAAEGSSIQVIATDYAFDTGGATVTAGAVEITLVNRGAEDHHLTLARVNDGITADEVIAGLRAGDQSVMRNVTPVGGPNGVAPGASRKVTTNLTAGSYLMMCHIPSPSDRVPHLAKGMVSSLIVSPATAPAAAVPASKGTITIAKGGYQVPAGLASGTYQVVNEHDQPAEAALVRLRQGATAQDVMAFLGGQAPPGPPPFSVAGGVTTLAPRSAALVDLEVAAGTYA